MDIMDRVLLVILFLVVIFLFVRTNIALNTRIPTDITEAKVVRIEPNTYAIQDEGGKWHLVRPITPPIKIEPPEIEQGGKTP